MEMYSVPKEYLTWLNDVRSSLEKPLPFFGNPPANAPGNIDKGAIGFFLASSVIRSGCRVLDYAAIE
jgi:hypothetical protein